MSTRDYPSAPQHAPAASLPGHSRAVPGTRWRECVPCEIPPFCRNHYFTGKLLGEQDFTAEQQYFRDKFRLHHRALHGSGVVCGLRVKPHPYCPELRLVVEPGLAIDACGYEIVVSREIEIELPRLSGEAPSKTNPYPPDTPPKANGTYGWPQTPSEHGGSYGGPETRGPQHGSSYGGPETHRHGGGEYGPTGGGSPEPGPPEPCAPRGPEIPVYVCLRYAECETGFMPAPFDECCNGAKGQQPSRICESFVLELRYEKPPRVEECATTDCLQLFDETLKPCPQPTAPDCIPLAFIANYAVGDRVTPEMIDNRTYRPLLPSVRLHDELLRCILTRLPVQSLTRVRDIGWTHGQEYRCHDFIRFFTGSGPSGPGFEVTFEAPVRTEGLSPRSFQALIARYPRGEQPGGPLEVAPAIAWPSADRTRFYLQIDRAYAERELDGTRFDVYIALRCNLILDEHGRAVDGDLIARLEEGNYVVTPPTGNGMPGGTLESWIRVRP